MMSYEVLNNTLFGHVSGHLVPGTEFLIIGGWWSINLLLINTVYENGIRSCNKHKTSGTFRSRVWYGVSPVCVKGCKIPVEPVCKLIVSVIGIIGELSSAQWKLYNGKDFYMDSINNFSHATMFSFFALSGIVDLLQHYKPALLPRESGFVALALAFFVEGFLFYFHLDHERTLLDKQSHILLYTVAFGCSIFTILELLHSSSFIVALGRPFLTLLQGSWFYQIAFMLYGPSPWNHHSEAAFLLAPVVFNWHLLIISLVFILISIFKRRVKTVCALRTLESNTDNDDFVSMEQLLPGKDDEEETNCNGQGTLVQL